MKLPPQEVDVCMDRMYGMNRIGRLELTVFQDNKPLITYFLFPETKVAFRKFRAGEKKWEVEEVDYHFAFEACKQLSKLRANGRKVRGNFLRYYNHRQQREQRKDVRMERLKKEKKIELWCF